MVRTRWWPLRISALTLLALGAGGCYQHVVSAKGVGASAREVYEPNLELEEDRDPWDRSKGTSSRSIRNWKAVSDPPQVPK